MATPIAASGPPFRPEAIFVDLDGTLLDDNKQVPRRSQRAIQALRDAGVPVIVATARHPRASEQFTGLCRMGPCGIYGNGALILDQFQNPHAHHFIEANVAQDLVAHLREAFAGINIGLENDDQIRYEPEIARVFAGPPDAVVDRIDDWDGPIIKVFALVPEIWPAALSIAAQYGLLVTRSGGPWVEFMHPQATKGVAALEVCRLLDVDPAATVAIGDNDNDEFMLSAVGWSAAPSHASDAARGAASRVLEGPGADAVATLLAELASCYTMAPKQAVSR